MTERERMLRGERYNALDPELIEGLNQTKSLLMTYNTSDPMDVKSREAIIRGLFGHTGERFTILQPFLCDYGTQISIGERFFANFNFMVLDEAPVIIGDDVFIGPNVGIYTACHPINPEERNKGIEWAEPVRIGSSVWIGGGVTICPGVTIGDNVTIGAGSVVVQDIPSNSVAVGNPARVVKTI